MSLFLNADSFRDINRRRYSRNRSRSRNCKAREADHIRCLVFDALRHDGRREVDRVCRRRQFRLS
jgi:hypothetical protein